MSQNCGLYGHIVHPRVTVMWTMVRWYRLVLTPNLSTRTLRQPPVLSADISGASRRMDEENENLVLSVPVGLQEIFNMLQNLMTWDLRRYFPLKGRCVADIYCP
jgi:hypothetical protein